MEVPVPVVQEWGAQVPNTENLAARFSLNAAIPSAASAPPSATAINCFSRSNCRSNASRSGPSSNSRIAACDSRAPSANCCPSSSATCNAVPGATTRLTTPAAAKRSTGSRPTSRIPSKKPGPCIAGLWFTSQTSNSMTDHPRPGRRKHLLPVGRPEQLGLTQFLMRATAALAVLVLVPGLFFGAVVGRGQDRAVHGLFVSVPGLALAVVYLEQVAWQQDHLG